jgi:DNA replication licensing factor MCM5
LSSHFVAIRKEMKDTERDTQVRSTIPITIRYYQAKFLNSSVLIDIIRQLEAIIRISESLAKMTLSPYATEQHVDEALRLFKYSTMDAVQSGGADGMTRNEVMNEVALIEQELQRRIPIGSQVPVAKVKDDLTKNGYSQAAINRALTVLARRDTIIFRAQGKILVRQSI